MSQSNPDEIGQIFSKNLSISPGNINKRAFIMRRSGDEKNVFLCLQMTEKANTIEVQGFEILKTKLEKIKHNDYNEFITAAKTAASIAGDVKIKSLLIPWSKVEEIEVFLMPIKKKEQSL